MFSLYINVCNLLEKEVKQVCISNKLYLLIQKNVMLAKCQALGYKLEKAMAPRSSTLAWKIPWMEEPGGLQSMGSLRVEYD